MFPEGLSWLINRKPVVFHILANDQNPLNGTLDFHQNLEFYKVFHEKISVAFMCYLSCYCM